MSDRINFKRLLDITGIIFCTIILSAFFAYYENMYIDEIICISFLNIIYLCLLVFEIEFGRIHYELYSNISTSYFRLFFGYMLVCLITGIMALLPAYAKPIVILTIIIAAVSNEFISLITSLFLGVLLLYSTGADFYEILGTFLLIMSAAILSQLIYSKKVRICSYILMFLICLIIPNIFYFLAYKEYKFSIIFYSIICGIISTGVLLVCSIFVRPEADKEITNKLLDIIDDNYSEVLELKAYSKSEYDHARHVSDIAYNCAKKAGLDENLCAVAGFYYRLGQWQGEPYIANSLKKANQLCFPEKLINILSEYYGEDKKPSTPESALVHMVDSLVIKMDMLKTEVGKSQWNSELIIYQTLNEFSSSGLYDQSGLGMNHFLIIRECLAKESKL